MINDENRRWFILAAMGGSLGLIGLDQSIVGVALPSIREALGMTADTAHWIVNAYLLTLAGFAATAGRIGDIVAIRHLFLVGVITFGTMSILCGFAQDAAWIIVTRGLQGIGAAILMPTGITMIVRVFPQEQRGLALGIQTTVGGSFLAAGPLVGGVLVELVSWRWIFWINVPVLFFVLLLVKLAWEPEPPKNRTERIDVRGLLTLMPGLAAIVTALMQGDNWGWSSPVILGLFAIGAALFAAFVTIELRVRMPLANPRFFRIHRFSAANAVLFAGQFTMIAVIIFCALYFQDVLRLNALHAGIAMLAAVVPTSFMPLVAGFMSDRFGPRVPLLAGIAVNCLALAWMALMAGDDRYVMMIAPLALWGTSLAYLFVPARHTIMSAVEFEQQGQASGVGLTSQLLGGTVSMAVCSTLLMVTNNFAVIWMTAAALLAVLWVIVYWLLRERSPVK